MDAAICCGRAPFHKGTRSAYWITRTSARGRRAPTALNPSTHGHCEPRSFPRKRESTGQTFGSALFDGLDSRFRGNDRRFKRDPIPNDTNTRIAPAIDTKSDLWYIT